MSEQTKKATHTPGPWIARHAKGVDCYLVEDAEGNSIAVPEDHKLSPETHAANARLIAAAPDLLEALEGLVDAWVDNHGHHEQRQGDCEDRHGWSGMECAYCIARAAITKATQTEERKEV